MYQLKLIIAFIVGIIPFAVMVIWWEVITPLLKKYKKDDK